MEVGGSKLEVGSWMLEVVTRRFMEETQRVTEVCWKLEVGSSKLEVGSWMLDARGCYAEIYRGGAESHGGLLDAGGSKLDARS